MSTATSTVAPSPANIENFVKLGDIKTAIAPLVIDATGLTQLGFDPVTTVRASKLYLKSDLPKILTAIAAHVAASANKCGAV